jgi:hypothetical protein
LTPYFDIINVSFQTKFECRAKVFKLKDGEYKTVGVGNLRLWRNKESDHRRLVMYTETGKNILNAALYASMKPEIQDKTNVKVPLLGVGSALNVHLIKVKTEDIATQLKIQIEANKPSE